MNVVMTINPFDLKTVLFARHAQHVVLIHFPIALFIIGVAFDFLSQWTKNRALVVAAYFNFWVAAISTLPAIATGLAAWQWALEGQKLKGILLQHLILACTSTLLIWIVLWIHRKSQRSSSGTLPTYRLPLESIAVVAIALAGHLGGFLSGVNTIP
jgi:uncharacterized membrane protein